MRPGQAAREHGVTLAQVARVINKSPRTVLNWHSDNPVLFHMVCKGVAELEAKKQA